MSDARNYQSLTELNIGPQKNHEVQKSAFSPVGDKLEPTSTSIDIGASFFVPRFWWSEIEYYDRTCSGDDRKETGHYGSFISPKW